MIVVSTRFRTTANLLAFLLITASAVPLYTQQNLQSQEPQSSHAPASGQTPGQFLFKTNVNRVVVDVVVTDANGKPVRGLTKEDFSVAEDGTPQSILSFDVHSLDSDVTQARKLPPMPPNTFVNIATEPERGPLYVLLLDLVNTAQDDQAFARQQLLKFISSKPVGTRFAVFVLAEGLHLVQGFTSDRDQLYAALDPSHPRSHVPRIFLLAANYGRGDSLLVISVLKDIALFVDGLPGRKNVIWVAGSFPLQLFPTQTTEDQPDLRLETREVLDALARSESALYPVDVRGVVPYAEGGLTGAVPNGGSQSASGPPGAPVVNTPGGGPIMAAMSTAGRTGNSLSRGYMLQDAAAEMTGGRAFYSRNDLKDALEEATEAGSDYYTITYSPSNENYDGKFRNIQVRLSQKGYRLEYRLGYYATGPESPIMPAGYLASNKDAAPIIRPIGDSLSANMQHGAPTARQVYFLVHVQPLGPPQLGTPEQMANLAQQPAYFRKRRKNRPTKPLPPVQLQTLLIQYKIIGRQPNLEVAAGVYDDEGRLLNGDVEDASSANPTASGNSAQATYFRVNQKIDVPVGAVSMRVAVRDISTDRIGAMEIPLPLAPEPAQASLPSSNAASSAPAKPN